MVYGDYKPNRQLSQWELNKSEFLLHAAETFSMRLSMRPRKQGAVR
jgi:hypothetical protein